MRTLVEIVNGGKAGSKKQEEERSLLDRSRKGDREAYGKLVERYRLRIFNLLLRMVGEQAAAEDLTQDAFIRAYQKLDLFDLERRFLPWMMRIAANLARNYLKSAKRREYPAPMDNFRSGHGAHRDAEREMQKKEFISRVERAMAKLPVKYRTPMVLKHVEGLSYREIREVMQLPIWVLKMRVSRARAKLLALLQSEGPDW